MAMTLSPKNERALAKAAIRSAQPALQSQEHMAWCEAWAQEHYGMPYEQIRQMPMDALEPKLPEMRMMINAIEILERLKGMMKVEIVEEVTESDENQGE